MEKLKCKYFGVCGGCSNINDDYQTTINNKLSKTNMLLSKSNISYQVSNIEHLFYPYRYRNKIHLSIGKNKNKIIVGFNKLGSKDIVDVDSCLLYKDWDSKLIDLTKKYLTNFKITPYDIDEGTGVIRYVVARYIDNQLLVVIVASTDNFPGKDYFYNSLKSNFNNVGLYVNINTRTDSAVFGNKFIHKYGLKKISSKILGVSFDLSPNSFFQINTDIAIKIYKQVLEFMLNNKSKYVLDLYSGIGITSCIFAKNGIERLISIEMENSSCIDQKELIYKNHLPNINIINGKCEDYIANNIKEFPSEKTAIFMDPPRSGCDIKVLNTIMESNISQVIYMSCNIETLIRDLDVLKQKYDIKSIKAYDMFAFTEHLELLVELKLHMEK